MISETQEAYAQSEAQFVRPLVKSEAGCKAVTSWAVASDKSVVARALYDTLTSDLRPRLGAVKIPVTVVYPWDQSSGMPQGMVDRLYTQNYAGLAQKRMVRIDNSFHFIMIDQPEAFMRQVDHFLGR
jgi:pimeloyl-ACP methyl ester carboxylesterase